MGNWWHGHQNQQRICLCEQQRMQCVGHHEDSKRWNAGGAFHLSICAKNAEGYFLWWKICDYHRRRKQEPDVAFFGWAYADKPARSALAWKCNADMHPAGLNCALPQAEESILRQRDRFSHYIYIGTVKRIWRPLFRISENIWNLWCNRGERKRMK